MSPRGGKDGRQRERAGTTSQEKPPKKGRKKNGDEEEDPIDDADSKTADSSTGKGHGKGKKGQKDKKENNEKGKNVVLKGDRLQLLLKVILRLLQDGRTLNGAILDVLISAKEGEVVVGGKEQGKFYMEQVLAKREGKMEDGADLGPPHMYVFGGMLLGLVKLGDLVGGRNKEAIAKAVKDWEEMDPVDRLEMVKVAKVEKCYQQDMCRIVLCFPNHPQRKEIINGIVQAGGSWKQGRPPKGAMERGLENWLEELLS